MKIKNISKLKIAIVLIFAVFLTSCDKWIDTDINISPNSPSDVPMKLLLPNIQANMAFSLEGNDLVRPTNIWLQYYNGNARQSYTQSHYIYNPSDVNNLWGTVYSGILTDVQKVIEKAEETASPHYAGVAKVCLAFTLGTSTDVWGNIPYSEAIQGDENLNPHYDSQESIYQTVQTLLTEAITALKSTDNAIDLEGDLIYGNDPSKWVKAAYALKARYAITLSKLKGENAYTEALSYLSNAFTSNDDNFAFKFDETSNHPMYMFMDERGDITMASTFINMLKDDQDKRITVFAADGEDAVGGTPGSDESEGISSIGEYAAAKDASSYLMTYAEQKFIEAEALLATNQTGDAYQAYLDGAVASNMMALGATEDDVKGWNWYSNISVGASSLTLELIMRQKYIAGYNTIQPFTDYRRTGFPVLEKAEGATTDIPRRFPYPQSELDYNVNTEGPVKLSDKVWWDK
jgi:hypothetical protein